MIATVFMLLLLVSAAFTFEFTVTYRNRQWWTKWKLHKAKFTYDESVAPITGSFGHVIRAMHDGEPCAVKFANKKSKEAIRQLYKEIHANRILIPDVTEKIGLVRIYFIGDTSDYDESQKYKAFKADLLGVDLVNYRNALTSKIPFKEICRVLSKVLLILEQLEAKGMTHRDIKPVNIMLGEKQNLATGEIYLVDFGLAHWKGQFYTNPAGDYFYMDVTTHRSEPPHPNNDVVGLAITGMELCEIDIPWVKDCETLHNDAVRGQLSYDERKAIVDKIVFQKENFDLESQVQKENIPRHPVELEVLIVLSKLYQIGRGKKRCNYKHFSETFLSLAQDARKVVL